jgi:hypothetical protein
MANRAPHREVAHEDVSPGLSKAGRKQLIDDTLVKFIALLVLLGLPRSAGLFFFYFFQTFNV